jgi:hypothetical protein
VALRLGLRGGALDQIGRGCTSGQALAEQADGPGPTAAASRWQLATSASGALMQISALNTSVAAGLVTTRCTDTRSSLPGTDIGAGFFLRL